MIWVAGVWEQGMGTVWNCETVLLQGCSISGWAEEDFQKPSSSPETLLKLLHAGILYLIAQTELKSCIFKLTKFSSCFVLVHNLWAVNSFSLKNKIKYLFKITISSLYFWEKGFKIFLQMLHLYQHNYILFNFNI